MIGHSAGRNINPLDLNVKVMFCPDTAISVNGCSTISPLCNIGVNVVTFFEPGKGSLSAE